MFSDWVLIELRVLIEQILTQQVYTRITSLDQPYYHFKPDHSLIPSCIRRSFQFCNILVWNASFSYIREFKIDDACIWCECALFKKTSESAIWILNWAILTSCIWCLDSYIGVVFKFNSFGEAIDQKQNWLSGDSFRSHLQHRQDDDDDSATVIYINDNNIIYTRNLILVNLGLVNLDLMTSI